MFNSALQQAYRGGYLKPQNWLPNIISGIVVGLVALPLAMAFAIASGAKPENGIYTAIVAGIIASTLGGSRLQISGPTGALERPAIGNRPHRAAVRTLAECGAEQPRLETSWSPGW